MPQEASWVGTPSIKGSTESVRMALLTFSLIGLQYVHTLHHAHLAVSIFHTVRNCSDKLCASGSPGASR